MNYIKEINAFRQWKSQNRISGNTQALWYELMALCNALNWAEEFTVPTIQLMVALDISRSEVNRIRNILAEKGRISYRRSSGTKAGMYRMIAFFDPQDGSLDGSQYGSPENSLHSSQIEDPSLILIKQNKTKPNETKQRQRKQAGFAAVVDGFSFDEEEREEIGNFIRMRTVSRKPLTDNALKLILTKLSEYSKPDRIAMLRASIINCWADVYPPKGKQALPEPEKRDYSTEGW